MKKIILYVLFAISFLFCSSKIAKAATFDLFHIIYNGTQQNEPLIYKNLIIWTDWRGALGLDIWGYDLKTKQEFPIIKDKIGHQRATGPSDKYLVYNDDNGNLGENDVRVLNLKTGEDKLVAGRSVNQANGVISGNYIVYIEGGVCGKLIGYNLVSEKSTLIVNYTCYPYDIYNNTVVYTTYTPAELNDVYSYDIKKKKYFPIAAGNGNQAQPDIYKNRVIWLDHASGGFGDGYSIIVKDLKNNEEEIVYQASINAVGSPTLSNKYVFWSEGPAKHFMSIKGFDFETKEVFEVFPIGPHQNTRTSISTWKNAVVWMA